MGCPASWHIHHTLTGYANEVSLCFVYDDLMDFLLVQQFFNTSAAAYPHRLQLVPLIV